MAGDWIKMRGNLWNDPRIARLCDLTDQGEAAIIGGLYWLWATADQHSEDGIMSGLSIRSIDRNTGISGFGAALVAINWIADHPEGVRIVRFDEHNGASAKKRCQTAKRVAVFRTGNADVTQDALQDEHGCVSGALAREREREEKNKQSLRTEESSPLTPREAEPPPAALTPTPAGAVCARLRQAGVASVNPSHPKLLALIDAGMTGDEIADLAMEPASRGKPFAWLLAAAEGRRREAATVGELPPARASPARLRDEGRRKVIEGLTGYRSETDHGRIIEGQAVEAPRLVG